MVYSVLKEVMQDMDSLNFYSAVFSVLASQSILSKLPLITFMGRVAYSIFISMSVS